MPDEIRMDRKTFESLASETRITILKNLDIRQMTITELSRNLDLAKSTIHEHLSKMAEAGLVEKIESQRKWSYYKLTYKGKRILHPHEMVKIMVLLTTSLLAMTGGIFEIFRYWAPALQPGVSRAVEMAQEAAPMEAVPEAMPAPAEAVATPSYQPLAIGIVLLLVALVLGYVGIKRWRRLKYGAPMTV